MRLSRAAAHPRHNHVGEREPRGPPSGLLFASSIFAAMTRALFLADAIGTQTEAIAVRGLPLSQATVRGMIAGKLRTGFIIGLALGALAFPPPSAVARLPTTFQNIRTLVVYNFTISLIVP